MAIPKADAWQVTAAEKNLERLLLWISRFDTKASVLLGINTAMLTVLATLSPAPNLWRWYTILFAAVALFGLAIAFFFIYAASYPQTRGPSKSLLYFGSIAANSFNEYQHAFTELSPELYLLDLLEQCHRNSEILATKFKQLKCAYRAVLISLAPWAIALYLFKIARN